MQAAMKAAGGGALNDVADARFVVHHGDNMAILPTLADCSVDAIVTDPPAGISFMQASWDSDKGGRDIWIVWLTSVMSECLRVLKPGGHALVWALPRTSHWTGMAIENAGFEVRDRIAHVQGAGFPKSLDVSKAIDKAAGAEREVVGVSSVTGARAGSSFDDGCKGTRRTFQNDEPIVNYATAPATDAARQWQGWGTALKPAIEDWWLARKPLSGTVAANVLAHGTGALNIDGCRVPTEETISATRNIALGSSGSEVYGAASTPGVYEQQPGGRWPANLIHSGEPEVLAAFPSPHGAGSPRPRDAAPLAPSEKLFSGFGGSGMRHGDTGSAARFFMQCPPDEGSLFPDDANRTPPNPRGGGFRDEGAIKGNVDFKHGSRATLPVIRDDTGDPASYFMQCPPDEATSLYYTPKASRADRDKGNTHSTVKPLALMRYLCRLITPPDGVVLDPFAGSGSTGQAAMFEGFRFIGIEADAGHIELARHRIGLAARNGWQPGLDLGRAA